MNWKTRGASFRSYELELIRVYEAVLADLSSVQLEKAANAVFDEYKDQVYTYTRQLIAKLKKDGYMLLAISGSQVEIIKLIAEHYGFDDYIGTVYERVDGRFSGHKTVPSHDKASALRQLIDKHQLGSENSLAIGDSLSDAAMLAMVEVPIAFNPDRDLFKKASQKGWRIVIERKNMIYELEKRNGKYQLVNAD